MLPKRSVEIAQITLMNMSELLTCKQGDDLDICCTHTVSREALDVSYNERQMASVFCPPNISMSRRHCKHEDRNVCWVAEKPLPI